MQVAFAPDGQRLLVSLSGENAVSAVDPNQRTLLDTYPVGPGPVQVFVSPDGKQLVVANQGSDPRRQQSAPTRFVQTFFL